MKTISEIEAKLKELDLLYTETRKGKKTSELTKDEQDRILAISEQGYNVNEELYQEFLTKGIKILDDSLTYACIMDDGEQKFIAMLNTELEMVTRYKKITDEQYNAFA